ncbi:bifunctional DNA primase/polymerase [Deinococcus radiopugnans]|uniref:Bifunctional DNA primase/polymerase n=1 Tax=Deinococcus radiopugnans ATCC 19172 TaxID=585398 RepID=A0A5C4Y5G9_9DEIO|nr:bifunctional DNA primase/polymerase [Deinococcus radiopugnans]MBB6017123.1 hypothetical protein [Deinococcus radiopugnans ATCC 19172]TNM70648.1 bifunctional DNA primase/polymerase [Deinococcus radiopugnans ATCC 19172]
MHDNEPELMLEQAKRLVARKISVIPTGGGLSPKAKQPHHQALKATGHFSLDREGRRRSSWKALQRRLPTLEELEAWYLQHRARGLGLVTGALSGYVAIDVDPEGLALVQSLGWQPHVLTPSGGMHFYLRHPGWYVPSNASKNKAALPPGVDVRGDGGYCMAPPSRNRAGPYRRTAERHDLTIDQVPLTVRVAGAEYRLREALGLTSPGPATGSPQPFSGAQVEEGGRVPVWLMLDRAERYAPVSRNRGAFMLGLWLHANGYTAEEAEACADEYAQRVYATKASPFSVGEAVTAIRSAYRYPRNQPWTRRVGGWVSEEG